ERARLELSWGIIGSAGGLPLAPALRVSGSYALASRFAAVLGATLILSSVDLVRNEASARVWFGLATLGAKLHLLRSGLRMDPTLEGGVAGALIDTHGTAAAPLISASSASASMGPYIGVAVALRIVGPLRARLEASAAAAIPQAEIVFADRHIASFGRP